MKKISAVINTLNEENNIGRCLKSLQWADEIILVDMHSQDKTVEIAKTFGAKIYFHEKTDYVEPARNFAINKAKNQWILVVDADETIPNSLVKILQNLITTKKKLTHVLIPRKNIILGKWLKHSGEWPNHQTRFFKKSKVQYSNLIHAQPKIQGQSIRLPAKEEFAIVHHYYSNISNYLDKINNYTSLHAKRIIKEKKQFKSYQILYIPIKEFFIRYIRGKGFLDSSRGLIHCLLMSFYYFIVYAKYWEIRQNS